MSTQYSPEDYYRAARELLPKMDENMRRSVEDFLRQAEEGVKTDTKIVEIISEKKALFAKFQAILKYGGVTLGYAPLGGDTISKTPNKHKYACPECDFILYIQKNGQDPGICPIHKKTLIPLSKKNGAG